jgi:hypothetical protein
MVCERVMNPGALKRYSQAQLPNRPAHTRRPWFMAQTAPARTKEL